MIYQSRVQTQLELGTAEYSLAYYAKEDSLLLEALEVHVHGHEKVH